MAPSRPHIALHFRHKPIRSTFWLFWAGPRNGNAEKSFCSIGGIPNNGQQFSLSWHCHFCCHPSALHSARLVPVRQNNFSARSSQRFWWWRQWKCNAHANCCIDCGKKNGFLGAKFFIFSQILFNFADDRAPNESNIFRCRPGHPTLCVPDQTSARGIW